MIIRNWFGVPAWVLASEHLVRTALEVYYGIPIGFVRFRAKTIEARESIDRTQWITTACYRTVRIEAEFVQIKGRPALAPMTTMLKLRKVGPDGVWCYDGGAHINETDGHSYCIWLETLEEDSLNRLIKVTKFRPDETLIRSVRGTSLAEREELVFA